MTENDIPERPRSFQVIIVDLALAGITDLAEREHYMALNVIQPSAVLIISIEDNDGECCSLSVVQSLRLSVLYFLDH